MTLNNKVIISLLAASILYIYGINNNSELAIAVGAMFNTIALLTYIEALIYKYHTSRYLFNWVDRSILVDKLTQLEKGSKQVNIAQMNEIERVLREEIISEWNDDKLIAWKNYKAKNKNHD